MIRNEYDDYPAEPQELNGRRARRKAKKKARKTKRKARRATRKAKRAKKGGILKRVWKGVKRFNPATIAMRNGVLAAAKIDLKKMSSRLRYAFLTPEQAQRLGVDMGKHQKIKASYSKLERKFVQIGGKAKNLKNAILKGRGNRDKKVPLSGFPSKNFVPNVAKKELIAIENILTKYENRNFDADKLLETVQPKEINGLGEPASAAVIAAATPVLIALMNMLNKSGVKTEQDMYPEEEEYEDYGNEGNEGEEYENEEEYYDE